ncbi:MAG: hypothetical protein HN576_11680 [Bacteriovoracaceae bacterium]|jgi:hypothetical protein|nr:hypothetical protein [Bacteriovoracaceae bacterium]
MLDDLISKIKGMLGQSEDDEDDEEYEEHEDEDEKTSIMTLKPKDEGDEDAVAKKKTMIIRGVVIVVIAWIFLEDIVMQKDPPPERKKVQRNKSKRKNPKKSKLKIVKATPVPMIEKNTEEVKVEPTIEATAIEVVEKVPEATTDEPPSKVVPDVAINEEPIKPLNTPEPVITPEPIITPEVSPVEKTIVAGETEDDSSMDSFLSDLDESTPTNSEVDTTKGLSALGDALVKIKRDKETPKSAKAAALPPDYIIIGRGLVYNCEGKHWACVDKSSYFQCSRNFKQSRIQNIKPACSVIAVYRSDEDCQVVQTHKINTSSPTDFCK